MSSVCEKKVITVRIDCRHELLLNYKNKSNEIKENMVELRINQLISVVKVYVGRNRKGR